MHTHGPNEQLSTGIASGETPDHGPGTAAQGSTPVPPESQRGVLPEEISGTGSAVPHESYARLSSPFFSIRELAAVLQVSKPTLAHRAQAEGWPSRHMLNRTEYAPPPEIAELILALAPDAPRRVPTTALAVEFVTAASDRAKELALQREQAVLYYTERAPQCGKELALARTVAHFALEHQFSSRSLRRWVQAYRVFGLNGLVDQKQGVVGRKGVQLPTDLVQRGKAMVIEHGSVARAARHLAADPRLPAQARLVLHGAHASKSYVTPSIRRAITPAHLTTDLVQGPRAARLRSRWTPGDYSGVKAGDVFVSDDMTANGYCWTEWPSALGWRIGQAQVLPVLDVGSLRWLNVRVIIRESGQYTSDDIWGLFGDTFDTYGLPRQGFVLEGGHWQSDKIVGARTGLEDETRIGGLKALGLSVFRSYDPRSKIIEGQFNQLQYEMDAFYGFSGRDQRKQLPESVKKQVALLSCKHPEHHPREFFPHVSAYADHVRTAMENLNHERQDGQVLRGASPLEKWAQEEMGRSRIPDTARWLYRSAMSVTQVTRNGARVTLGSGRNQLVYYYDNPELLVPRQGLKVILFWNHYNPDADAVLLDFHSRKYIGIATRVQPLRRFSATSEELDAEAQRKRAALHYARAELRGIQPELQRGARPVPADAAAEHIGRQIATAADQAETTDRTRTQMQRKLRRTQVDAEDLLAATHFERRVEAAEEEFDAEAVSELFNNE